MLGEVGAREVDDELLERDGCELESELGGADALGLVETPVDRDGREPADALSADHGPIGDELLDGAARARDGRRGAAHLVGVAVEQDLAPPGR